MKVKKVRQMNNIGTDKSYIPDAVLADFFRDWLHLHKKKTKLAKEGRDISDSEKREVRNLDRRKVYILDNIVFPSMTNLIYFFEVIATSQRLAGSFEDEIAELLDPRESKEGAQVSGRGERFTSMQFRQNNLSRLIMAMLSIPKNKVQSRKPTNDFRIGLMYQIQTIVGDKMEELIMNEFFINQVWKSAVDDYQRIIGWLALLSRSTEVHPTEYDRKIGFLPIGLSNNARIFESEFNF